MSERGESSLVGLLVASTLFLGVMSATLSMFGTHERVVRNTSERAEAQVRARTALDRLARELRNVEAPSAATPQVLERSTDTDLVMRAADSRAPNAGTNTPNVRRIRWCLDAQGSLWRSVQTWTSATAPAMLSTAGCPGGWPNAKVAAQDVVNAAQGVQLFAYDNADARFITAVRATVAVDADTRGGAAATRISTGVFLRNQDRPPSADFDATVSGQGVISLNASRSSDPDNAPMTFSWTEGSTVIACRSIICSYDPPGEAAARTITLTVTDAAGLTATATKVVTA